MRVHNFRIYDVISLESSLIEAVKYHTNFPLYRDSIGGDEYRGNEQVTGRTIVVTGANTGMGKALSLELAKRGNIAV